jgi:hypothetical protein
MARPREECNIPYPPVRTALLLHNSGANHIFTRHQARFQHLYDDVDMVIQAGSFMSFAEAVDASGKLGEQKLLGLGATAVEGAKRLAEQIQNDLNQVNLSRLPKTD